MEIPRSMFPRPVRGIPSNSGANSLGDGGGGGGGPKRTRSIHEQSGSRAFLQASKISPYRQPLPSDIGEHPSPDGSAGRDDVSPGTHITKEAFKVEDADSSSLPEFRGAGNRCMPSPTYPEVEAAGFDSGVGIAENSGLPGTSTYGDSSTNVKGCDDGLKSEAANGPFLGFGFEVMEEKLWEQGSESRGEGRGGRDRSTSRHEVDEDFVFGELRGNSGDRSVDDENATALGCDLGWGAEGMNFDDSPEDGGRRWGERVDEEQAEEPGDGKRQEGRASEVPGIDPHWQAQCHYGPTRSSRARSQSFYEGDDNGEMMANMGGGDSPVRKRANSSSAAIESRDCYNRYHGSGSYSSSGVCGWNRHGSLAYSSSGEIPASDLDAWPCPRDSSGLTAPQAAAVFSAGAPGLRFRVGSSGGVDEGSSQGFSGVGGGSGGGGTPSSSSGQGRLLRPNEHKALIDGLHGHIPGRKTSSEASSDSEPDDFEEDSETYRTTEEWEQGNGFSRAYDDSFVGDPSSFGTVSDEGIGRGLIRFPDTLAFPEGGVVPPPSLSSRSSFSHRSNSGDSPGSPSILRGTSLVGGACVFPPGVDPFVSPPDGAISPPLSPPAGAMARGLGSTRVGTTSVATGSSTVGATGITALVVTGPAFPLRHLSSSKGVHTTGSSVASVDGRAVVASEEDKQAELMVDGGSNGKDESGEACRPLPSPKTEETERCTAPNAIDVVVESLGRVEISLDVDDYVVSPTEASNEDEADASNEDARCCSVPSTPVRAASTALASTSVMVDQQEEEEEEATHEIEALPLIRSRSRCESSPTPPRSPLLPPPPPPEPIAPSPPQPAPGREDPPGLDGLMEEGASEARRIELPAPDMPAPAAPESPEERAPSTPSRDLGEELDRDLHSRSASFDGGGNRGKCDDFSPILRRQRQHMDEAEEYASGLAESRAGCDSRSGSGSGSGGQHSTRHSSCGGSTSSGNGMNGDGSSTLWRSFSSGGSCSIAAGGGLRGNHNAVSFGSGGSVSGGGGGISRLMGPDGPFGSNRPGYYSAGFGNHVYAARARYGSGGVGGGVSGGGGRSNNVYGSDPGTMGAGSSSSGVQGFLSAGGGARYGLRRGYGASSHSLKIKLLMLGDSGVGKSSLMDRFTEDRFNISTVGTVGVDFKPKTVMVNDEEVLVQVWDTAGQQRFHKITQAYYRGSHGIVLVYDISDPETLDNIAYWMKSIRENAGSNRVQICLVGNKVDLRDGEAESGADGGESDSSAFAQTCSGKMIADQFDALFFECSAKTGFGVEEAYMAVTSKAVEAQPTKPPTPSSRPKRRFGRRKQQQQQQQQQQQKHQRHPSWGSDKDRPPRSDGSWSTGSPSSQSYSHLGVDSSSAERLDSARVRHCSSDVSEASSPGSGVSQGFSPGKASRAGSCNSGIVINQGTTFNASGFITPACPSPTTVRATMTSTLTSPSSVGSPTGGGVLCVTSADSASPNQQQQQQRPMLLVRQPSPPSLGEVSENYGLGRTRAGTGVMVSTLGKKAGGLDEEISPTGTGTLSPLPGHQRSIGRASSLAENESYSTPPSPNINPRALGDGDGGRRRADTGNFLERVFRGGGGGDGTEGIGDIGEQQQRWNNKVQQGSPSSLCSPSSSQAESMVDSSETSQRGTEVALDQNHEPAAAATTTTANVSRTKSKKPPRVPRIRRQDSPGAGEGGGAGGGRGRGKGCKIS